jgi:hypothetical protein
MKKFVLLLLAFGSAMFASAQSTTIDAGIVVKLAKATHIAFQSDLIIDGQLLCDTSTIVSIGTSDKSCRIRSDNPLRLSSLKLEDGTNYINVDTLLFGVFFTTEQTVFLI